MKQQPAYDFRAAVGDPLAEVQTGPEKPTKPTKRVGRTCARSCRTARSGVWSCQQQTGQPDARGCGGLMSAISMPGSKGGNSYEVTSRFRVWGLRQQAQVMGVPVEPELEDWRLGERGN
jgi:hypothetical protein